MDGWVECKRWLSMNNDGVIVVGVVVGFVCNVVVENVCVFVCVHVWFVKNSITETSQ